MSTRQKRTLLGLLSTLFLLVLLVSVAAPWIVRGSSSGDVPLIRLRYATFDPLAGEPSIPTSGRLSVQADRPATYIIQFTGPVQEGWKASVGQAGARLYGYVPDYAFFARMIPATAEKVHSLPFVRWVGLYHPAYRLAPELQMAGGKGQGVIGSSEPVTVTVQTFPDVALDALSTEIEKMGGKVLGQAANSIAGYIRVLVPPDRLDEIAALDEVLWVEPYFEPQLYNDVGGGQIMQANEVRSSLHLYGSDQIVAVADTGLDTGDMNTLHPDLQDRVIKAYCLGRPSPCDWSDYVAHGTHVAGSVLGNGLASGSNPSAHQYANSYAGVAPESQLVFQSIADAQGSLRGIPNDIGDLMRQAYPDGARIHTNSWGGPTGGTPQNPEYGGYTAESQQADQAMWEHKDMLVLFAAGNEGVDTDKNGVVDPDSIGSPGTAKNVLTVGATENNRSDILTTWGDSYGSPINSDRRADNPDGMAAFSSRGPTDDGRIKPDIVAPGTYIVSLRTRQYAFNDNLEGDTSGYSLAKNNNGQGTGDSWQLLTDAPHSPAHYWKDTVNGYFGAGAMTLLLTPPINIYPTGGAFDLSFWHRYSLGGDNQLVLLLTDADLNPTFWLVLNLSGNQSTYTLLNIGPLPIPLCDNSGQCIDPASFVAGFAIYSEGGNYNSEWWLDDIRVDGADWGTLGSVGLTQPGSSIDESYLLMGGTSMATPLTAGAAALVREWLTERGGVSSPSGALMKAVLLNGAADMSPGQYGTGATQEVPSQRPNNVTGWGRVDLVESLNPPFPREIWFTDNTTGLSTGGTAVYTLTIGPAGTQSRCNRGIRLQHPQPQGTPEPWHPVGPMTKGVQPFSGSDGVIIQGAQQLLQNPGFEMGDWSPWQTYGSSYLTNIIKHTGSWAAHMGNYNNADDEIWQQVDIPADATDVTVDFWYRVRTDETYYYADYFCYGIWDQTGYTAYVERCLDFGATGDRDWAEETYSLNPYELANVAGQRVWFGFYVVTDSSLPSRAWVDDTGLYVTTPDVTPTPTNTPVSTPTPTETPASTPTPTETPTTPMPTSTPATCPETIADGGFEQATGDFSHPDWEVSGNARFTRGEGIARSGQNAAILGYTSSPATGDLWQAVSVPADASSATLTFWYQTLGDGSFSVDVDITNSDGSSVLVHLATLTSVGFDWQQFSHTFTGGELAAIAGQNVRLRFRISGVTDPEDVVVDDVSWQICTGGGVTPTPTGTPSTPTPPPTGGPFRVTLVWTDYPGQPLAAKVLVNDLDLEVIAPDGTHYYGNQGTYTGGQCLRGGKWDACNNVEGVVIPDAPYGTYTIIVHGYNVAQGPQPFAVAASGDYLREGGMPSPGQHRIYLPLVVKQ